MKTLEKLSCFFSLLAIMFFSLKWFNEKHSLKQKLEDIKKTEQLPLQVKVLEPNVVSIYIKGFEGDIWWLEGSPLSETDFIHIDSTEGFKKYITGGNVILKVPPKAIAYILRGEISEEVFSVDYYFESPKSDSDTSPENDSF